MSRRYEVNAADSLAAARRLREKFQDEPATKEEAVRWEWPRTMREVGRCAPNEGAVMYTSNKWQSDVRRYIDYKHVGESEWRLYVRPGFLRLHNSPGNRLEVFGPTVELTEMPRAFAVLAPVLGIQARLYDGLDEDGEPLLPEDDDEGYFQITISGAKLGAAEHPTGKIFLIVYDKDGVCCLITGANLDVGKDGIGG